ncbi:MAG: hypothetical protein AAF416_14420 [Pseudomonadota bacterium]
MIQMVRDSYTDHLFPHWASREAQELCEWLRDQDVEDRHDDAMVLSCFGCGAPVNTVATMGIKQTGALQQIEILELTGCIDAGRA